MKIRRLKRIMIVLQILMLILPTLITFASEINIGDTLNISRGDLGFYSIQYWSEYRNKWMYITYSRTYYTDTDGSKKIAYCMDPDLDGVGWLPGEDDNYDTEVKYEIEDEKIWRILKNGYPNVTPEALGVETEDDAYIATKQAVYWIIRNRDEKDCNITNIYMHFRAGETEINNQKLEDIQRRGKKVVDAIYKLVDIAINNTNEVKKEPEIVDAGDIEPDADTAYYSKKYRITDTGLKATVKITKIKCQDDQAFITDENGNIRTEFAPGETFKIMVHKDKIMATEHTVVSYTKEVETYPIYYTASKTEGKQNYVILLNKNKEKNGELYFNINGNKSRIEIIKKDEETGEPISGVKFQISSETGEVIDTRVTDENGVARLSGLKQGNLIVEEIETNENYELDTKKYEVKLGYDETYILNITNKHKKGDLIVDKVDKDDNDTHLEGVEFDIMDKSGTKILHIMTDCEGKAKATLNTGEYILKKIKTKKEYKIGVDQNIKINWNETLELKIENEKKKGKIKIIKQDKEDKDINLAGVDFEILNENKECVEKLTTNENGEAISSDLAEGKYYIKEINTQENYILDSEEKEVRVNEDEVTDITIENERIKGKIEILKTSEDKNKVLKTEKGMPLEGIKFEVYNENNEIVDQIVTDKDGKAITKQLYKGKYKVKEIETNEWYILDENEYDVEIKNNEEIVTLSISNKSKDPMVEITKKCRNLVKPNEELDYTFEILNNGNTDFETFTWYDYLPSEFAKITKIETGTYNQDTTYSIYYKTNLKDEYMVVKKNLKSTENNYINLTDIYMEENEVITEIKVCFDNVKVNFKNKEKPHIFMKLNDDLVNGDNIENRTLLEGTIQGYRTTDEDTAYSTLYNVVEKKKLPRTGY